MYDNSFYFNYANSFFERQLFYRENLFTKKLGWQDSNLRMAESKSAALPLGDTPKNEIQDIKSNYIGQEGIRTPDTVVRSHVL